MFHHFHGWASDEMAGAVAGGAALRVKKHYGFETGTRSQEKGVCLVLTDHCQEVLTLPYPILELRLVALRTVHVETAVGVACWRSPRT